MKNNVVNVNDLEWKLSEKEDFAYYDKELRAPAQGEKIGTSLYKLMPGKKAFPFHYHYTNEEAVFVLEGEGTLRMNEGTKPIKQGDYVAFPVGPDFAHQIINTSQQPLIFLCFSTMEHPEVVEYPDSEKVCVTAGVAPGGDRKNSKLRAVFRKKDQVNYFDGEV